jgi:hypothetical protein
MHYTDNRSRDQLFYTTGAFSIDSPTPNLKKHPLCNLKPKIHTRSLLDLKTVKTVSIRTAVVFSSKKLSSFYRTKTFSLTLSFQLSMKIYLRFFFDTRISLIK